MIHSNEKIPKYVVQCPPDQRFGEKGLYMIMDTTTQGTQTMYLVIVVVVIVELVVNRLKAPLFPPPLFLAPSCCPVVVLILQEVTDIEVRPGQSVAPLVVLAPVPVDQSEASISLY